LINKHVHLDDKKDNKGFIENYK